MDKVRQAFHVSIKTDPGFLVNYVDLAEYVTQPTKDWNLFCTNINETLDPISDETTMTMWPLYNALAVIERARSYSRPFLQ